MRKITGIAYAWASMKLRDRGHNPYPKVNLIHRDRVVAIQGQRPGHKILCYDPPEDVSQWIVKFDHAWAGLSKRPKYCIYARYVFSGIPDKDGHLMTVRQIAVSSEMSKDTFDRNVSRGMQTINGKLFVA